VGVGARTGCLDDLELELQALLPAVEEQLLEHLVAGVDPDQQVEGEPVADHHLLHVEQLGAAVREYAEQTRGDPRPVASGASHEHGALMVVHVGEPTCAISADRPRTPQ
jgi:hypothetical protein